MEDVPSFWKCYFKNSTSPRWIINILYKYKRHPSGYFERQLFLGIYIFKSPLRAIIILIISPFCGRLYGQASSTWRRWRSRKPCGGVGSILFLFRLLSIRRCCGEPHRPTPNGFARNICAVRGLRKIGLLFYGSPSPTACTYWLHA